MSSSLQIMEALMEAGMSEAETLVYFELLKKPVGAKWELVGRTRLGRNKVYRALQRLESLGVIRDDGRSVRALSLRPLVNKLRSDSRKNSKLASKLEHFSPYLQIMERDDAKFEGLYTVDDILEAYMFMADHKYDVCLDFGDLEGFVEMFQDISPLYKFRDLRSKHAKNLAISTTDGPYTRCMARPGDLQRFGADLKLLEMKFLNQWMIFSDNSNWVMITDFADRDFPSAALVQSPELAAFQRQQFLNFSRMCEK